MVNNAITFSILPILDQRLVGMARPQHPWGILEGLIYDMKKNMF